MNWLEKNIDPPIRSQREYVWICNAWGIRDDGQSLFSSVYCKGNEGTPERLKQMQDQVSSNLDTFLYDGCHCRIMWRKSNRYKGRLHFSLRCLYHKKIWGDK